MRKPTARSATRRLFLARTARLGAAGLAAACRSAHAAETPGWQIGCYTRPWDRHDYRVALDQIAEAGYKHAGLMTTKSKTRLVISAATSPEEAQRIGEAARQRGLGIPSVYGGGIPVATSLEAGIEALRWLVANCAAAKAANLLMGGIGKPELYDRYYKAIAECCPYAQEQGVGISVKPHGGLNATGAQCRKAVERVGHPNFRVWYDPGNILYYSDGRRDPAAEAAAVDGLVVGMCVKDFKPPKDVWVTPGDGEVDFAALLARLREGGFRGGPLVVECVERGDLAKTLAEAKKARRLLERLVGRPGEAQEGE
ncbi:MAG: sugar phosphate isomerase/epimerase family protein [Candidatus Brocadiia bacterium]